MTTEEQKLIKKLRLDKANRILIVGAPDWFKQVMHDRDFDEQPDGSYDYVHLFAYSQKELVQLCIQLKPHSQYDSLFWISYPKLSGKIKSDIKRDTTWAAFGAISFRPVMQISIDETWSALRGRPEEAVGT